MKFQLFVVTVALFGVCSGSFINPGSEGYGVDENVVEGLSNGKSSNFEECLRKDSISCVQMQMFRMAKKFFDQPSLNLFNGIVLEKSAKFSDEMRSFSSEGNQAEQQISKARNAEERESVLENYVMEEARNFFEKRNVNWNVETLARNAMNVVPEGVKKVITDLMTEGRGRRKVLRMLLPFLLGLKVKFGTILGLTYLGVILLAKKALLLSIVSIAISIFLLLKKMMHHGHEEVYPGHGFGGWQSHSDAGHVEYAAHSAPVAHHMAYGAQKP